MCCCLLFFFIVVVGLRLRNCVNIRGSDVDGGVCKKKKNKANATQAFRVNKVFFSVLFLHHPGQRDNARKLSCERRRQRWRRQRRLRSSTQREREKEGATEWASVGRSERQRQTKAELMKMSLTCCFVIIVVYFWPLVVAFLAELQKYAKSSRSRGRSSGRAAITMPKRRNTQQINCVCNELNYLLKGKVNVINTAH